MSPAPPADRIAWAVDLMAIQPDEHVLEVGCGHGVAVTLIADRLHGGHVVGLDQSSKMIAMAERRNSRSVTAGIASFVTAPLASADLGTRRFDRVLAIHVGVFLRGNPAAELEVLRRHLAPAGRLYLSYQPFKADDIPATAAALTERLDASRFEVIEQHEADLTGGRTLCIVAWNLAAE